MAQTKKIRAVMFDLDGTLLDTAPDFVAIVNMLLQEHNRPALPDEKIRACVSNGARALVCMTFEIDETYPEFQALRLRLLELYIDHLAVFTKPFPGIENLLRQLAQHNIPWGIATNKPAIYTSAILTKLNLQPPAASVICPEHVKNSKPDPESLFLAGEQIGCTAQEIIYIGDHQRDIECGKRAGSITIAAAYGYIEDVKTIDTWQADYCVNHADEIWPIVSKYIN